MTLVLLTWTDAMDYGKAWASSIEAQTFADQPSTMRSTGFLVSKTEKFVTLAGDWDTEDRNWGRLTKVPTGMVTDMQVVYSDDHD